MNRLQNSIVRFIKFVIELENLIILLNIRGSFHKTDKQEFPSIHPSSKETLWLSAFEVLVGVNHACGTLKMES